MFVWEPYLFVSQLSEIKAWFYLIQIILGQKYLFLIWLYPTRENFSVRIPQLGYETRTLGTFLGLGWVIGYGPKPPAGFGRLDGRASAGRQGVFSYARKGGGIQKQT